MEERKKVKLRWVKEGLVVRIVCEKYLAGKMYN